MGIFSKGIKDISLKDNNSNYLVEKIKTQNSSIFIGAKLKVPDNFTFVIGRNGKVLDIFSSGEYVFDFSNLPIASKKLKINKTNDESLKNRFVADAYYINTNYISTNWESFKIVAGNRAEGFIKYSFGGKYTYKVKNEKTFMQSLLNELSYIKTGEAEKIVDGWINDEITKLVDKNMFTVEQIVNNSPVIHEKLFEIMKKMFDSAGVELVSFDIDYYKLPKVYQKQNDEAIKKQKQTDGSPCAETEKGELKFKPFGNFVIKTKVCESDEKSEVVLNDDKTVDQSKQEDIQEEHFDKNQAFVDLNTDNLYNTKVENLICQFCGEINDSTQDHCKSCGNLLRSE